MSVLLLSEDNDDIATSLTRLFRRAGMIVLRAADRVEALQVAVAEPPDVVVTDLGMPRRDGWRLIEAIRDHEVLADTPIVILSEHLGYNAPRMAGSGACAVLLKPCPNDQILATVEQLLARGAHRHGAPADACPALRPQAAPAAVC